MKSRILIIGDDITGAAEIGGIAFLSGYSVRILFELKDLAKYKEDVFVLDTHSRGMKPEKAEKKLKSLLKPLF